MNENQTTANSSNETFQEQYTTFLKSKAFVSPATGFEPRKITKPLFQFQKDIVDWAVRRGRAALFEGCGLGKTIQELEWGTQIFEHTKGMGLLVAPLSVSIQTKSESIKFGYTARLVSCQEECKPGINITNFEKLHKFDGSKFTFVIIDESSILKSFNGETRTLIIDMFSGCAFKLAATATPAPNDYMELANHAEFLGIMRRPEMLATFFVHDGGETSKWRLKGHARHDFWRWICSWAVNIRKPSDLGYKDDGFDLPPLDIKEIIVDSENKLDGYLFELPASSMDERRKARKASTGARILEAVELCNVLHREDQIMVWCDLNYESEIASKWIDGCVEVSGHHDDDYRADALSGFIAGHNRVMVSKPSIFGFGMNLQHCHIVIYCGLSDSWERFYQSLRRFWRFGQREPVTAYLIISNQEQAVLQNIKRKERDVDLMMAETARFMSDISSKKIHGAVKETDKYIPKESIKIPLWLTTQK